MFSKNSQIILLLTWLVEIGGEEEELGRSLNETESISHHWAGKEKVRPMQIGSIEQSSTIQTSKSEKSTPKEKQKLVALTLQHPLKNFINLFNERKQNAIKFRILRRNLIQGPSSFKIKFKFKFKKWEILRKASNKVR